MLYQVGRRRTVTDVSQHFVVVGPTLFRCAFVFENFGNLLKNLLIVFDSRSIEKMLIFLNEVQIGGFLLDFPLSFVKLYGRGREGFGEDMEFGGGGNRVGGIEVGL